MLFMKHIQTCEEPREFTFWFRTNCENCLATFFLYFCQPADELDPATPLSDGVCSASSNRMLAHAIVAICRWKIALSGFVLMLQDA